METPRELMSRELTVKEARELFDTSWWKRMDIAEAANLQLRQRLLCMPFEDFHLGIEKLLGRPVWTHEFAGQEALIAEADGKHSAPSNPIESLTRILGEVQP